jgi:hypothetical protein
MRHRPIAFACAALLAAACGGGGGGGSDFIAAADALAAKMGKPGEKADMPAADDPAVKAFNAEAERGLTALGTDAMPVDGFTTFEKLCGKAATIVGTYVSAGGAGGAAPQQMAANAERYMEQMFTPLLFAAHCSAAHMPFLEEQAGDLDPAKKGALEQMRNGATAQAVGLIQLSGDESVAGPRRQQILDLLARDAANFALGMTPDQRAQVVQMAAQLRERLPDDQKAKADTIRTAFEETKCGRICSG